MRTSLRLQKIDHVHPAIVSDLAYYSFSDDKSVFDRLINLPCFPSNKVKRNWKRKNWKKAKITNDHHHNNLMETASKFHEEKQKI